VITPARNEAENLRRLGRCLTDQSVRASTWVIVDNGSEDETGAVAAGLARQNGWVKHVTAEAPAGATRAEPIVYAFHCGVHALPMTPDVLVKLDADISVGDDFFQRLLYEFGSDPSLGIAGGIGYEQQSDGTWRQRHGTGSGVWGGCRGYRWRCLQEILPLEQRMGWDTMDLFKANVRGWRTQAFPDLPFRHHRPEGIRDGTTAARWAAQGEAARYMGYRFSYLLLKTVYRALREPAALAIVVGYAFAAVRRDPVSGDEEMRAHVRSQQRARQIRHRIREARRPRQQLRSGGARSKARGRHL